MNGQPSTTPNAATPTGSGKWESGMIRTVVSGDPDYDDSYQAKLVKYIPAEVLAAFIPLVALADQISSGSKDFWIWMTIGIGAAAVFGYARWHASDVIPKQLAEARGVTKEDVLSQPDLHPELNRLTPNWYVYVLGLIAFGAWALATAAPVQKVVGLSQAECEYIVAAVTFLLPLADGMLSQVSKAFVAARDHERTMRRAGPAAPSAG